MTAIAPPSSRNDPCPCGSGKRYKHCHGSATAPVEMPEPPPANAGPVEAARAALRAGRAADARGRTHADGDEQAVGKLDAVERRKRGVHAADGPRGTVGAGGDCGVETDGDVEAVAERDGPPTVRVGWGVRGSVSVKCG